MVVYSACRENIYQSNDNELKLNEVLKMIKDTSTDDVIVKYLTRLKQKLKMPLQDP
jgi:hypothetical protein